MEDVCWALSYITAGTKDCIQDIVNHKIIPLIVKLLTQVEVNIRKTVARVISNAISSGNKVQIKYALQHISSLCEQLSDDTTNVKNLSDAVILALPLRL